MLLDAFHTAVKGVVKRGSTLDAEIVIATRQAAKWMERNFSFKYMERFVEFNLDSNMAQPRAIAQPPGIKSISFMKVVQANGKLKDIGQFAPQDLDEILEGEPSGYWIDGTDYLWFDTIPDTTYLLQMLYVRYSTWPTEGTEEPWLLAHADDVLLWQTVIQLGPILRDDAMLSRAFKLREEGLRTLLLAEDELRNTNTSIVMNGV